MKLPRPLRPSLFPALALAACFLAVASGAEEQARPIPAADKPGPVNLPVVKTWKDLLAQPLINIGDGHHVRLGIERTEVAAKGAITVYALFEDLVPFAKKGQGASELGPLQILDPASDKNQELAEACVAEALHSQGYYLCRTLVLAPKEATKTITVADAQGRPLAYAKIALQTDGTFHAWTGLALADSETQKDAPEDEAQPESYVWPGESNLVAEVDEVQPLFHARQEHNQATMSDEAPLPVLLPELPDAPKDRLSTKEEKALRTQIERLHDEDVWVREAAHEELRRWSIRARVFLANRQNDQDPEVRARIQELLRPYKQPFTISYDGKILHLHSTYYLSPRVQHEAVLLRVWINGKPWLPSTKVEVLRELMMQPARCAHELDFSLTFNMKALGTKAGDTLSIQALYCPNGYKSLEYSMARDWSPKKLPPGAMVSPMISNVSNWKIPSSNTQP